MYVEEEEAEEEEEEHEVEEVGEDDDDDDDSSEGRLVINEQCSESILEEVRNDIYKPFDLTFSNLCR